MVIDQLGAGAGGLVVSAYDPNLDRKVALKVLRPEVAFSGGVGLARERLLREAKAVARMNHPNVVTVHEVGSVGDQVFVAMEHIDGGTLRDTMSLRKRGWRQVLDLFVPAARGLAAAHQAGLVHRDFKPANVLVSQNNRVVVSDFGLVSTAADEDDFSFDDADFENRRRGRAESIGPADPGLTDTGTTLGTPAYMAPEQHRGAAVDARSDQFAFSVALHEALFGQRPFQGNTLAQLMAAKDRGEFTTPEPSADVPSWLRQIVVRGMASDPADRFSNMDELIAAIEVHRGRPKRNWLVVGLLALLVPTVFLGYRALTQTTKTSAKIAADLAALKSELADKDAELAENRAELAALRRQSVEVDPSQVAALEARQKEVETELATTKRELESLVRNRKSTARELPDESDLSAVVRRAPSEPPPLATRTSSFSPPLPLAPESELVSSIFAGMRRSVERCVGVPDLSKDRSYDDWVETMESPTAYNIVVSLEIRPNGRSRNVSISATDSGNRTCVGVLMRRARFPISQNGGTASFRYSRRD